MKAQQRHRRGFTLVELLAVMAIIAVLAAIAIPTLIRAGAFRREYISQSGRTLYNMLRAAELYATTHNVETCLAYAAEVRTDSVTGLDVVVARSIGVFRRATEDELTAWQTAYDGTPDQVLAEERGFEPVTPVFVPTGDVDLIELRDGACVLGDWDYSVDPPEFAPFWDDVPGYPARGLRPVRIRTLDGLLVFPKASYIYVNPFDPTDTVDHCWMAHVFSPSGYVVSDTPQERLVITVGPTPDSAFDDRFVDLNQVPGYPVPVGYMYDYYPVRSVNVQISKSSGRVKLVE